MSKHPYHCISCGQHLEAAGLGTLICTRCDIGYVPTLVDGQVTLHACVTYDDLRAKQESEGLPPCPWCGSPATDPVNQYMASSKRPSWEITCPMRCVVMRRSTRQEVIKDWSDRA